MAFKTLEDAIAFEMQAGPAATFPQRLEMAIRDWAAHKVSSYGLRQLKSKSKNSELKYQISTEIYAILFPRLEDQFNSSLANLLMNKTEGE